MIPLYDGYVVPPKEGELHRKRRLREGRIDLSNPPVWNVNIDNEFVAFRFRSLQLLWDNSLLEAVATDNSVLSFLGADSG